MPRATREVLVRGRTLTGRLRGDLEGVARFGGLSILGLALMVGMVPLLVLAVGVATRWAPLARLDEDGAQRAHGLVASHEVGVRALEVLTEVGGGIAPVWLLGVGAVWLLVRRHRELATFVAVTGAGLAALVLLSEELVGLVRTESLLPAAHLPASPGFPSGHAMTAVVVWGCLAVVALPVTRPSRRPWLVGVTTGIAVLTGLTRTALGVHRLSDVLAGWVLGGLWLAVTVVALRSWLRHRPPPPGGADPSAASLPALHVRTLPESALPGRRGTVWPLLLAFGAIAAVVYALGLLVIGPLQQTALGRMDEEVVRSWEQARRPWMTEVMQSVDLVSGVWGILVAGATVAALGVAHRGSWRPAVVVLGAVGGEVLLYWLTTSLVGRARPDVEPLYTMLPIDASFPSGHVAATVTVYGSASALALTYARGRRRWLVVALAVLLAGLSMAARIYLGAHYPADVVVGLLLGTVWVWAVARVLLDHPSDPPRHARWDTALRRAPGRSGGRVRSPRQAGST